MRAVITIKRGTKDAFLERYVDRITEGEIGFLTDTHQLVVGTDEGYVLFDAEEVRRLHPHIKSNAGILKGSFPLNIPERIVPHWYDDEE